MCCQVVIINISPPPGRYCLSIVSFVRGLVRTGVRRYSVVSGLGSGQSSAGWLWGLAGRWAGTVSVSFYLGYTGVGPGTWLHRWTLGHLDWTSWNKTELLQRVILSVCTSGCILSPYQWYPTIYPLTHCPELNLMLNFPENYRYQNIRERERMTSDTKSKNDAANQTLKYMR